MKLHHAYGACSTFCVYVILWRMHPIMWLKHMQLDLLQSWRLENTKCTFKKLWANYMWNFALCSIICFGTYLSNAKGVSMTSRTATRNDFWYVNMQFTHCGMVQDFVYSNLRVLLKKCEAPYTAFSQAFRRDLAEYRSASICVLPLTSKRENNINPDMETMAQGGKRTWEIRKSISGVS